MSLNLNLSQGGMESEIPTWTINYNGKLDIAIVLKNSESRRLDICDYFNVQYIVFSRFSDHLEMKIKRSGWPATYFNLYKELKVVNLFQDLGQELLNL